MLVSSHTITLTRVTVERHSPDTRSGAQISDLLALNSVSLGLDTEYLGMMQFA